MLYTATADLTGLVPPITSPDWSKDMYVKDDPLHGISKWLGGQGVILLATLGMSRIAPTPTGAPKAGKLTPNAKGILPTGDLGNIINVGRLRVRLIGGRIVDGVVQISSASRKGALK